MSRYYSRNGSSTPYTRKYLKVSPTTKKVSTSVVPYRKTTTSTMIPYGRSSIRSYVPRAYPYLPLSGEPVKKMVRLKYISSVSIDPGTGSYGVHSLRANSMFDPNLSGAGHQPMGFGQQMSYYDHFTVLGSKITVRQMADNVTNATPGMFIVMLSDEPSPTFSSVDELLESRGCNFNLKSAGLISGFNAQTIPTVTKTYSARKFFGPDFLDDKYQGTAATNPDDMAYFHIYYVSVNGNNPGAATFVYEIQYIALLTEPKNIVGS